jgi:hypothetical protein
MSESSTAVATPSAYNLFLNSSTNDATSYSAIWHCAYMGNSYINGVAVTYDRQPYLNGIYQGGNSTTYKFGTSYYKTADSTYYTGGNAYLGEWVQIKLPFKMKLTAFSHRTRYVTPTYLGRNPNNSTVFGSNDGVIWYVVHTQSGVSTDLTPVTVNTTTFPDGKHSYSYFRWVINSTQSGEHSYYANVVNENQWNLIGIRTT